MNRGAEMIAVRTGEPTEAAARLFWEGEYADWFKRHAYPSIDGGDSGGAYPFYEVRLARVLELAAKREPGRCLEIGTGGGHIIAALAARGWRCEGCDFARPMLSYARDRLTKRGLGTIGLAEAPATDLAPFGSGSYDLVLCLGPLEYLSAAEAAVAFAEMRRVLKPDGVAITAHVNGLLDLVTLDSFTVVAFANLVREAGIVPAAKMQAVEQTVRTRLGAAAEEGRGSIRTRIATRPDNPLTIRDWLRRQGFTLGDIAFYRFYPAPPFVERAYPELGGTAQAAEQRLSRHWLGHFLAAGFLALSRPG